MNRRHPNAFTVAEVDGRFSARGYGAQAVRYYDTREEAEARVARMKANHEQIDSLAGRPPAPSGPTPGPEAAFSVVDFGEGAGFGTLDQSGGLDPAHFPTRRAAESHAARSRSRYESLRAGLQGVASGRSGRPAAPPAAPPLPGGPPPASVSAGPGAAGLGAAAPKVDALADAAARAAAALSGVADARAAIPLSPAPRRPAASPPPAHSAARRAVDGLASAMGRKAGDLKGFAEALRGFRSSPFGGAQADPPRAPAGVAPPGGYPGSRSRPPQPAAPAGPGTYGLDVGGPAGRATPGLARQIGQAIASHLGAARRAAAAGFGGGYARATPSQVIRSFIQDFGRAFARPGGGIPVGYAGAAGSAARRAWGAARAAAGGAANAAGRAGSGAAAGFAAYRGGAGAAGILRAVGVGVGGGAGAAIGAAAAPIAALAAVGAVVSKFGELVERMKAFGEEVASSNRYLSRWNGSIGSAYMMMSAHDFRRQVALGRATQGSAITAVRLVDSMRDQWQGVDVLQANLRNRGAGFAASFAGAVGEDLSRLAGRANRQVERLDPDGLVSAGTAAGAWGAAKGFVSGYYESFLNNPVGSLLVPGLALYNAVRSGQDAGAAAADAKVVKLAGGATDPNPWGAELNRWAERRGPLLRRPTPRP